MRNSKDIKYYSQYDQDKVIDGLMDQKTEGYFLDIGAHDGISFSNTLFFEKFRNWSGLCFEPIPEVFEKCKKNRTVTCINAAISDKTERLKFTLGTDYVEMLSGITKFRDVKHLERTERDRKIHGGSVKEIEVQALNLNDVLKQERRSEIDFITLDIEGGEFEVLKSINFTNIKVKVISVELNYYEVEVDIKRLLKKNGFIYVSRLGSDGVFVNRQYLKINRAFISLFFGYRLSKVRPFLESLVRRLVG